MTEGPGYNVRLFTAPRGSSTSLKTEPPSEAKGVPGSIKRKCPYCEGSQYKVLYTGTQIPGASPQDCSSFDLVCCNTCRALYVNPAPAPQRLMSYYADDYYREATGGYPAVINSVNRELSPLARFTHFQLVSRQGHPRVLEVGCAVGNNLQPYVKAGWEAWAIEPNPALAEVARGRGIQVVVGFVGSNGTVSGQFDVVILSHVLEHDYDPNHIIRYCLARLSPSGDLYVEVPLPQSLTSRLFGRNWGGWEFPTHLTLLRREQWADLLSRNGLRTSNVTTRSMLGTTLRSLRKIFPGSNRSGSIASIAFACWVSVVQVVILSASIITRTGDALVMIASSAIRSESK